MPRCRCITRFPAVLLVLLLGACASYSPPPGQSGPVVSEPEPAVVTSPKQPEPASGPPVSAHRDLLARADAASSQGDYEAALALLERAQRIEPDNADIYLELARTYAARGDQALARATAERGLLYCRGEDQCGPLRSIAGQ